MIEQPQLTRMVLTPVAARFELDYDTAYVSPGPSEAIRAFQAKSAVDAAFAAIVGELAARGEVAIAGFVRTTGAEH